MPEEGAVIELVDEAPDMTATEFHVRVVARLRAALSHALRDRAGVFGEIFLRVDGREQVAADLFAVLGVATGDRTVYAVPAEPAPSVTARAGLVDRQSCAALIERLTGVERLRADTVMARSW